MYQNTLKTVVADEALDLLVFQDDVDRRRDEMETIIESTMKSLADVYMSESYTGDADYSDGDGNDMYIIAYLWREGNNDLEYQIWDSLREAGYTEEEIEGALLDFDPMDIGRYLVDPYVVDMSEGQGWVAEIVENYMDDDEE